MSTSDAAPAADLRFPTGKLQRKSTLGPAERRGAVAALESAPAAMRAAVRGLSDAQLDTEYRPGGWTVRQVVHHLADSHMNAYLRFKLALTETNPTIKPYDQDAWVRLADSTLPVSHSLDILDGMHARLVHLLRATPDAAFTRTLMHPENGQMTIDGLLNTYAWHGRHHVAHVTALRERMQWS